MKATRTVCHLRLQPYLHAPLITYRKPTNYRFIIHRIPMRVGSFFQNTCKTSGREISRLPRHITTLHVVGKICQRSDTQAHPSLKPMCLPSPLLHHRIPL